MNASVINCPNCNATIPLTEAIERPIVERVRGEFSADAAKKEAELRAREQRLAQQHDELRHAEEAMEQRVQQTLEEERKKIAAEQHQKAQEAVGLQLRDLQNQITEDKKKLGESERLQLQVLAQQRDLEAQKQSFELEKAKQIEAERQKIREETAKAVLEQSSVRVRELEDRIAVKDGKLAEAQEAELKLRKEKAEFEEQKRAFELELARRAEEVGGRVKKEKDEEFRLKEAEKNKQMEDMKRQIDELKRKAEQGSQQAQGEVLELDLESALRRCFGGEDEVVAVPKGTHGGDVLQHVRDEAGHACGMILWESKRTKNWSDGWLGKLKDDALAAGAQLTVIVSVAMPKDVPGFECREGVWVTPPTLAVPLAAALRLCLIETAAARRALDGRADKMEMVYDYLSGPQFRARVGAIVETFTAMRDDLESEKRAVLRLWAKREKQIERLVCNTSAMHGEIAGMIGKALPPIDELELTAVARVAGNDEGNGGLPVPMLSR